MYEILHMYIGGTNFWASVLGNSLESNFFCKQLGYMLHVMFFSSFQYYYMDAVAPVIVLEIGGHKPLNFTSESNLFNFALLAWWVICLWCI